MICRCGTSDFPADTSQVQCGETRGNVSSGTSLRVFTATPHRLFTICTTEERFDGSAVLDSAVKKHQWHTFRAA
ncbi:hypothetical protein AGIG_G25218 [Arapaima gigas]